jgi:hypothetical protein
VAARIVSVNQIEAAREQAKTQRAKRVAGQLFARSDIEKRGAGAGEKERFVTGGQKAAMQPQRLPLSSAHFAAAVEVEDTHQRFWCGSLGHAATSRVMQCPKNAPDRRMSRKGMRGRAQ